MLASMSQLLPRVEAAQAVSKFLYKTSAVPGSSVLHSGVGKSEARLELWTIDLVKILSRFGDKLAQHPLIIYNLIPRFSPPKSRIHRQCCANGPTRGPVLNGLSSENWDNLFTKIAVGRGCKAQKIACGDKYFVLSTLSARGIIKIFRTRTCEELVEISHDERVLAIRLSASVIKAS